VGDGVSARLEPTLVEDAARKWPSDWDERIEQAERAQRERIVERGQDAVVWKVGDWVTPEQGDWINNQLRELAHWDGLESAWVVVCDEDAARAIVFAAKGVGDLESGACVPLPCVAWWSTNSVLLNILEDQIGVTAGVIRSAVWRDGRLTYATWIDIAADPIQRGMQCGQVVGVGDEVEQFDFTEDAFVGRCSQVHLDRFPPMLVDAPGVAA